MSRHQRFSAAVLLVAASIGLGACSNDPTGVRPTVATPSVPLGPQSKCVGGGGGGIHGDTIVDAIHAAGATRAAMVKVVECFPQ